jgi:XRE family transcriptional regulator, regulator of sulfur utilization
MTNDPPAIGPILKSLRTSRKLTLEELAQRSNVSKSMLSQIERGLTNPTIATLWNLTQALGTSIAELVGKSDLEEVSAVPIEFVRSHYTPTIKSHDGKCLLRILSPVSSAGSLEWYELIMEPDACLSSEPHSSHCYEHLTVLEGRIAIASGQSKQILESGDTARYPADISHSIQNIEHKEARALLVVIL